LSPTLSLPLPPPPTPSVPSTAAADLAVLYRLGE
jgi:hypothetical protein